MTRPNLRQQLNRTVEQWVEQALQDGELELNPRPQCRVCREPSTLGLVNKMLARGFTVKDILAVIESLNEKLEAEGEPRITRESLYNHRKNHFDIQQPSSAIFRKIQEDAYRQAGGDLMEGTGTMLNAQSFHQTVMVKAYETLTQPGYVADPMDGAKASLVLYNLQKEAEGEFDQAHMQAEFGRFIEAARAFVPRESWDAFNAVLRGERIPQQKTIETVRMVAINDTPDVQE
jgi:hypothetical protein